MQRFDFTWEFPLPRVHTGMLLGNGRMGAMIWGGGNVLKITLGRGDWWDHRGGKQWTDAMNWPDIRRLLEAHDEAGIRAIFAEKGVGGATRATIVPVGRFELRLPVDAAIIRGRLDRHAGVITIDVDRQGTIHTIAMELTMDAPLLRVSLSRGVGEITIKPLPAYETAGDKLAKREIAVPTMISEPDGVVGFVQSLPDDPPLTAVAIKRGSDVWISTELDDTGAALQRARESDDTAFKASRRWWSDYWSRCPKLTLPNPKLQFLYDYGMYKFAGLTCPLGVAAGLQGPWIEDYTTPPWSGDYHFNINVQMCYTPAYAGNQLDHLRPLFDLIGSWMPLLREHARKFMGIDDGLMLPHAVDDRCKVIGSFWTGTIDHGCTAWVGKMMHDYWSFGGADDAWAKDVLYPFLHGAMRVYEEMLDREGDLLVLPVSVSPEYRGAEMNAWGRNASFQLACIHYLCEKLIDLSARFGQTERPIWREILAKLPRACVQKLGGKDRIFLWENTPLEESHRHHSHLAGITPFDVIDPNAPEWQEIVKHSVTQWIAEGMGHWSGWCIPWAVQLHTRAGNAGMAEMLLEMWQRVFTNEGHGTLHDCEIDGLTLMGAGASSRGSNWNEIMQMDACMGVVTAITDLVCYAQRGVYHFFKGRPKSWPAASFEGVRTEGGFLASGSWKNGETSITITATRDGTFKYADPKSADVKSVTLKAGEKSKLL